MRKISSSERKSNVFVHRCLADAGIGPCSRRHAGASLIKHSLFIYIIVGIAVRHAVAHSDQPLKMEAIQKFNSSLEVDEVRNYQL